MSPPPTHISIPGKVHTQDTLEGCDRAESRRADERPCAIPHRSAKRPHRSVRRLRASACCEYRAFLCEVGQRRPRIPPGGDVLRRLNSAVAQRRRRIGPCTTAFAPQRASERWPCSHSLWTVGVAQRVRAEPTVCSVAVFARPVVCVGRAVGDARLRWAARAVFQAAVTAMWCLWSFRRLWVAVIRRHSESAADLPRR